MLVNYVKLQPLMKYEVVLHMETRNLHQIDVRIISDNVEFRL